MTTVAGVAVRKKTEVRSSVLQGLDIGFFVALAALVVYWVTMHRTTLGFELRAVGFNREAARYAGMSVARSTIVAMLIAGAFVVFVVSGATCLCRVPSAAISSLTTKPPPTE